MKQIPNLFTLLNLVCGCIAIVCILKFAPNDTNLNLSGLYLIAGTGFILLAAVVDFLDGFVARLFKATSAMGEQLDSLADAVSFGVAPGMIMYKMLEKAFYTQYHTVTTWYALLPALLIPCAAVWRLAKFNLDKEQRYYFKGAPTPAVGLFIASLPFVSDNDFLHRFFLTPWVLIVITIAVSALMVSNFPLISLKFKNKTWQGNFDKIIMLIIGIISIILFSWAAPAVIFIAYLIVSLIFKPQRQ